MQQKQPQFPPSIRPPVPVERFRRTRRFFGFVYCLLLLICAGAGFGLWEGDAASLRGFTSAVNRWQVRPEFRTIAREYCSFGSRAMQIRPFGVPAAQAILAIRSAPGLPPEFAVNDTSRLHYENFSRGPLCAYLHLCNEQNVEDMVRVVEKLQASVDLTFIGSTRPAEISDQTARELLAAYKMDFPVVNDVGAFSSARSLFLDIGPEKFVVRAKVGPLLSRHISAVARDLGIPSDPWQMTRWQQQAILDRLDARVRIDEPELWRTKQLSDFSGGVWAQVFGPPYNLLLEPTLIASAAGKIATVVLLWLGYRFYRRKYRATKKPAPPRAPALVRS